VTVTLTVALPRPETPAAPVGRVPRVTRLLALAHRIDAQIRSGEYRDLADAARKLGLTRARLTQISQLVLLAPSIQREILTLPPVAAGRDPITERTLRPIVAEAVWGRQMALWCRLSRARKAQSEYETCSR
jgi:hypothetical protein